MPKKEDKSDRAGKHFIFNYTSLILLIVFLIIPLAFFFLLSTKIPEESFGVAEIAFSIIFAVLATAFLVWTKSLEMKNTYLGTIIGIIALGVLDYALFIRYKGPYTTTFAIISSVIVLIFLGINFVKGLKNKQKDEEEYYEDNPTE